MTCSDDLNLPSKIFLYDEPRSKSLNVKEISKYIEERTGLEVETREDFLRRFIPEDIESLAKKLASARVKNLEKVEEHEPMHAEVGIEKRLLTNQDLRLPGILYDGLKLHGIFQSMIPKVERNLGFVHMAFTERLFGTFNEDDRRYHARVIICGYPSIISTSGIVEAPAKPRGFYAAKEKLMGMGIEAHDMLKEEYKGEFIDYEDERMTEVMKGYAMQAFFFHLGNEPFCSDPHCRLFNAHWQSEAIEAQLGGDRYCAKHEAILECVRNEDRNR
jgi:hypothetical protein